MAAVFLAVVQPASGQAGAGQTGAAQDTSAQAVSAQTEETHGVPLLSGGVGFLTSTNGGNTTYLPIIEPLIAAPLGPRVLVESRAALTESFSPNTTNGKPGYDHTHFAGLTLSPGRRGRRTASNCSRRKLSDSIRDLQRTAISDLDRQLSGRAAHHQPWIDVYRDWSWRRIARIDAIPAQYFLELHRILLGEKQ